MEKRHSFTSPITAGITNKNRTLFTLENITSDKSAVSGKMTHKSNGNTEHSSIGLNNRSPSPHRGQFGTNTGVLSKSRLFEKSSAIDSNSPNTFPKSPILALKSDGQSAPKVSITFSPRAGNFVKNEGVSASDKSGEIQTDSGRLRSDNLVINATRKSRVISDSYATMDDNNLVSTTMSPRILESSKSCNIPNNKTGSKVLVSMSDEKSLLTNSYSKSDEIPCDSVSRDEGQRSNKTRIEFSSSLMTTSVTKQQQFVSDMLPSNMNGKMDHGSSEVKLGVSGSRSETQTTSDYSVVNINGGSYNSHVRTSSEKLITQVVDRTEMGGRRSTSKVNTDFLEIKVLPLTPNGNDITENEPSLNKSLSEHRTIVRNETGSDTNTQITSSPAVAKKFIDLTEKKSSATSELNSSGPKPQVNIMMSKKVSDIVASQKFAKEYSKEMAESKNILGIKLNWRKSTGGLETKDVENKYGGSVDDIAGNKITMKGNSDLSVKFTKNSNDSREMSKSDGIRQELCESGPDFHQGRGMDTVDLGIRLARSGNSSDKLKAQDEEFIVQKSNSNSEVKLIDNQSNSKAVMPCMANKSKVSKEVNIQKIDSDTKSADSKVSTNKMAFTNEAKDTGVTQKNTKDISHKQTDAKAIQHQTHKHTNIPNNSEVTQSNKQALSKNPKETTIRDADETGVSKTPQETLATKTHSKDIINKSYGINVGGKDKTSHKDEPIGISISQAGKTELVCKPGETKIIDENCKNIEKKAHMRDAQFENVDVTHLSNDSKVSNIKVQDSTKPTDVEIIKKGKEGLVNDPKGNKSFNEKVDLSKESNVLSISEVDSPSVTQQRKEVKSKEGKVDVSGTLDNNKVKDHRLKSIEKIEIKTTQGGREDKGGTENRGGSTNDPKDTGTKPKQKSDFSKKLSDGKSALMEKLKFFSKPKETKINQGGKEMSTIKKPECNVSKEKADLITKPEDKISKATDMVTNESVDFTDKTTDINFSNKQFDFTDTVMDTSRKSANTTVTREVSAVTKTTTGIGFTKTEIDHTHEKSTDSEKIIAKMKVDPKKIMSMSMETQDRELTNYKKSTDSATPEKEGRLSTEFADGKGTGERDYVTVKSADNRVTKDTEHLTNKSTSIKVSQVQTKNWTGNEISQDRECITEKSTDSKITEEKLYLTYKLSDAKIAKERELVTDKPLDKEGLLSKLDLTKILADIGDVNENSDDYVIEIKITEKDQPVLNRQSTAKVFVTNEKDAGAEEKMREQLYDTAKDLLLKEKMADKPTETKKLEKSQVCNADRSKYAVTKCNGETDFVGKSEDVNFTRIETADLVKAQTSSVDMQEDNVGKKSKTGISTEKLLEDHTGKPTDNKVSPKKKDDLGSKPTDNKVLQKEKIDLTGKSTGNKVSLKEKVDLTGKPMDSKVSLKEKVDLTGKPTDSKVLQIKKVDLTGKPMESKVSQKEKVDLTSKPTDSKVLQKEKIDLTGKPMDSKVSQKAKVDLTSKPTDSKVSQKGKVDLASKPTDSKVSQKEKVDLTGKPTDSKVSQKDKEDLTSKPTDSKVSQKEKVDLTGKPTDSKVSQKEKVDLASKPTESKVSQKEKVNLTGKPTDSKVSQKEKVDLTGKPSDSKVSQKEKVDLTGKPTDSKVSQKEKVDLTGKPTDSKVSQKEKVDLTGKPTDSKVSQKEKVNLTGKPTDSKVSQKEKVDLTGKPTDSKVSQKEKVDLASKPTDSKVSQKEKVDLTGKPTDSKVSQKEKVDLIGKTTDSKVSQKEKVDLTGKPTDSKLSQKEKSTDSKLYQNEDEGIPNKPTEKKVLLKKVIDDSKKPPETKGSQKGKFDFKVKLRETKTTSKGEVDEPVMQLGTKAGLKEKVDLISKVTQDNPVQKMKGDINSKPLEAKHVQTEKVDLSITQTKIKAEQGKVEFKFKPTETKVEEKGTVDLTGKLTKDRDLQIEKDQLTSKPTEFKQMEKGKSDLLSKIQKEKVDLNSQPTETISSLKEKVDLKSKPIETKVLLKEKVDLTSKPTETISSLKEKVDLKSKPIETKVLLKEKVDLTSKPTETISSLKEKVDLKSKPTETKSSLKEKVDLNSQPTETKSLLKEKVDLTSKPTETKSSLKEKVDLKSKTIETKALQKEKVDLTSKPTETKVLLKEKVDLTSKPTETKSSLKEKVDLTSKPTETKAPWKEKVDLKSKPTETKSSLKEKVDLTSKPIETKEKVELKKTQKQKVDLKSESIETKPIWKEKIDLKVMQKEKEDLTNKPTEIKPTWKVDLKVTEKKDVDIKNKSTDTKPFLKEKDNLKPTQERMSKPTETKSEQKEKEILKPRQVETRKDEQTEKVDLQTRQKGMEDINIKPTETKSEQNNKVHLSIKPTETKSSPKEKVDLKVKQDGKIDISIKLNEAKSKQQEKVNLSMKPTETKSAQKERVDLQVVQKEKVDLTNKPIETKSEQQGQVDIKVKKKEKVDLTNKPMETKSEQQAKVDLNIKQTETISTQKEKVELLPTKKEKLDLSSKPAETKSTQKEKVDLSIKPTETKSTQKEKMDLLIKKAETKTAKKEKVDLSIKPAETKSTQKEKVDISIKPGETKSTQKEKMDLFIKQAGTKSSQKEKVDLSIKPAETKTAQKEKVDLLILSAETKSSQKEKVDLSIKPAETKSTQKETVDLSIKLAETKTAPKGKEDISIKPAETKSTQKEKMDLLIKPAETKSPQKEKVDLSIKPAETKTAQKEKVDISIKPAETKYTHKEKVDLLNKPTEAILNQKEKIDILNKVTETKLEKTGNESNASQKSKTGFSDKQTTHKDLQLNKVDLSNKLDKTKTTQENTTDLTKSPADSLTVTTDFASKLRETTVSLTQNTIHTTQVADTKTSVKMNDTKHTENNLTSRSHAHTSQQGLSHSDTQTDRKLTKIENIDPTDKGMGRLPAHKEKDNFSTKLADTKELEDLKRDLTNEPKDVGVKVGKRMEFIMNPTEDKVTNERKNEKIEDHGENRENVNVADKPMDKKGTQKGNKHLVDKFMEAKSKIKEKLNVSKTTDDKRTSLKSKTEITGKPTELKVSQNEKVGLIVKPTEPVSEDSGSTKKERVDIMTVEEAKHAEKSGVKDLPEVNRVKDIGQVKVKLSSNEKMHFSDGKIPTDENKIETTDASSGSESRLDQLVDLSAKKSGKILENEKSSDKKSSDKTVSESEKQGKGVTISKTKSLANKIFEKLTKNQSSNKKGPGELGKKSTSGNKKVELKKQSDLEHDKDIKIVSPGDVVLTKTYEGRNSNVKSSNTDTEAESEPVHKPDSGISSKNVNQLIKEKSRALVYTERKQTGDFPNERSQVKSDIDNKAYKNSFDFPDTGSCNLHSSLVSEEKHVETQHQRREDQRNGHVLSEVIDGNTTTFIEENRSAAEINAAEINVNLDNETRREKSVSEQSVSSSKTLEESTENGGLSLSDRGQKLKQEIDDLHAMFISKKTQWEKTDSKNKKYSSALWSDLDSSSDTMNSVDSIGSNKCVTSSDPNFTEMRNGGRDFNFTGGSDEYSYIKQKKSVRGSDFNFTEGSDERSYIKQKKSVETCDVGQEKVMKKQSDRNDWESGIYGKFCNGETDTRRKQTPGATNTSKQSYKNESDIYKRTASDRTRSESANKTLPSSSLTNRCDIENMFCIRHYTDDFCDQENKDRSTKNVNDHDPVSSGKSLNEKYSDIYSRNNEHSQKEQTISQNLKHLELNGNRKTDSYLSESKNGSEIGIGGKSCTKSRKNIGEIVKNEILKQPIDAKKDIPNQSSQTKNECKFREEIKEMEDEQKLENIRNMLKESLKSNKDAEPKLSKSLLKDFILDDDEDDYDISGIMGISNMINKSSSRSSKGDGRDRRAGSLGRSKVLHVIHEEDENVSESGDSSGTKSISNDRSRFNSQMRHSSNDVSEDDYLYHRRSRRYDRNPVDDETSGEGVHDDKRNGGKYHVTDVETNEICKSDRKVKKISDDDDDDDDLRNGSVGNIRKYKSLPDISRSTKMEDEELDQWYKNKYGTDDVMEWLNNQVPMTREPSKAYEYKVIEQDFSVPSRSYIDHLTTYIPPRLPIEKPELFEISPETATLTWKPARVPDRIRDTCNLSYTIEVRNPPTLDWRELVTGLTSTSYDLKNLHPRLDYLFRIRAWNEYGCSEPTLPISLHRPIEISNDDYSDDEDWDDQYKVTLGDLDGPIEEAPPKLPMEAPRVTDGGESAMLSWFPARIPAYAKKTPITYIVEIKEPNIPGWSRLSSGISDTTYFVEDLRPKEDYQFRIKAETQFGVSDPTLPVSLDRRPKDEGSVLDLDYYEIFKRDWEDKSTKRPSIEMRRDDLDLDIPQRNRESSIPTGVPPRIPSSRPLILHQFSDRLTLSWLPGRVPSYVKNSKISYLIEVRELPSTKWRVLVDNLDDNEYDVTNLKPDQNYMFRVRAKNSHGSSDPTLPANVIHDKDDYVPLVHSRSGSIDSGSPWVRSRASSVDSVRKQKSFDFTDDDSDIYINRESKGYPPEFKAPVENVHYGVEGKSAKVTLGVRGYPLPTTTWYFLGDKLDYGNLYKAFITPGGTASLEINKLTRDLAGDYKCCAENEHGKAVKIVKLEIADPPTIIESTRDLALENRRSGKLVCRVDGIPTPTVKFLKDWRPLASSSRMKIHHEPPDQWSLNLDNAITMDSGLYACVAENMAGKATCLAKIAVEDEDSSTEDRDVKPKHQQIKEGWAEDYYYVLEEIGRGRHGIVRRVIDKSSGSEYAAKFIHVCDDQQRQFFHHEIENLKSLNHKNTLGIVDAFQTDRRLVIITELITGRELLHRVTAQDNWTEGDTASVIQQLLETVKYLHKHGVLHLDIKPSNIHYTSPNSDDVKLIDFGFSRHLRRDLVTKLNYGTPGFTSPEQIANEPLSSATDVWGIGTLTYLLLLGRCPFDTPTDAGKLTKIQACDWQIDDSQSDGISKDAKDFISRVLLKEPSKRLTLEDCLSHPWIKNSSKGQGHKADIEKLKTFQSSDIDQRLLSGVRTVAKLHSLNWILGDHTDDSTLKQTVNDATGQTSFPDSVPYGEFLDQESWYEWQSRVYYGLDADVDAESDTESVSGEPSLKKEREWLRVAEEFKQQSQKPQDFFPKDEEEEDNPQFTIKLHDVAFQVGDDIILSCHVTSSGSLNVSWYRNEELITDGGRIHTSISDSGIVTLTVVSSKPYDDGIYKCVVRNQTGKSSSSCRVSLGDIPSQPGRPVVTQISSCDALLVWEHPESDGNSDIIQYRVDYRETGSSQWKVGARTIDDCALVTGLQPDTCYRFRVSCSNEFGTSSYSVATVETKTKSAGAANLELSDFTAILLSQQHEQHTPPTVKTVSEEDIKPREINLQDTPFEEGYTTSDTLRRGRFSSLVLSRSKATDKIHVTKTVPYTEADKDFVLNVYETLRKLSHERLVRLYESYLSKDMLYLVLEYLSGVNVLEHFSFKTKYTEDMVATVVKQVLDGVHYLHQQGYVHLNLQPDSVVMVTRRRLNIRITGFKLARKATKEGEIVPQKGNPEFIAPEVVTQEKTSYPADIWTVGVLTFILLSGESPYFGLTEQVTFSNIAYNRYNALALYENITKDALKFIFRTLKRIPRNRITSEESLDDKWIQSSDIMVRSRRNATFSTAKLRAYVNQCHRQLPKYSVADLETLRQRFFIKPKAPRQSVVKTVVTEEEKKTQLEKKQRDDSAPSKEEVKGDKPAKESEGTSQALADEVQTGEVVKSSSVEDIAETLVTQAMEDALQSNEINKEE